MNVFVLGRAARASGHIAVDNSSPSKAQQTYIQAVKRINNGVSLAMFPEGSRSKTGELGTFKRGAFLIADKLQLPVLPITIKGTYEVMPKHRDFKFTDWHPLRMTIHQPIQPIGEGHDNVNYLMAESHKAIEGGI